MINSFFKSISFHYVKNSLGVESKYINKYRRIPLIMIKIFLYIFKQQTSLPWRFQTEKNWNKCSINNGFKKRLSSWKKKSTKIRLKFANPQKIRNKNENVTLWVVHRLRIAYTLLDSLHRLIRREKKIIKAKLLHDFSCIYEIIHHFLCKTLLVVPLVSNFSLTFG